ncbi:MAG: aspartyl/asparaginyl beta-hydroxylase domain-containing protein [Flammeovirgaceae bacterium]
MASDIPMIEKPATIRQLGTVHLGDVKQLVAQLPQALWAAETSRRANDYFCFHDTEHILFVFMHGENHENYVEKPLWNFWKPKLMPLIEQAVKPYGYERGVVVKAMFAKLKARGKITKHIDYVTRDQHVHKIHIPIITNPAVKMLVGTEEFYLQEGEAYEVNNLIYHAVNNDSDEDRVHFIFEYYNRQA